MIAFTEEFTRLGKIASWYTLIVTGNVVLGLASREDISEVKIFFCVCSDSVVWVSNWPFRNSAGNWGEFHILTNQ